MRASEMCIEKIQFFPRLALKCGKGNQQGVIQTKASQQQPVSPCLLYTVLYILYHELRYSNSVSFYLIKLAHTKPPPLVKETLSKKVSSHA